MHSAKYLNCEFSFPFPPYDIQNDFMKALYETLEDQKLGIFESPTGTGKSLSLICGSLTWLEHHLAAYKKSLESVIEEPVAVDSGEDWLIGEANRISKENEKRKARKILERVVKVDSKFQDLRQKVSRKILKNELNSKKQMIFDNPKLSHDIDCAVSKEDEINDCILEEYASDEDDKQADSDSEEEREEFTKIYYCSRTHSQLSQFAHEIKKTSFRNRIRVAFLGSRANLCINDTVSRLPSLTLMNEKCIELRSGQKLKHDMGNEKQAKKPKLPSCPFAKASSIEAVKDQLLVEVLDLEQLSISAKNMRGCPYYASRKSVQEAQLVVMPYNCLLHKQTRETCNIRLKNSVVIVDEAHNLLETLSNINSMTLTRRQICGIYNQMSQYLLKFERRLSAKNLLYIRQIMFLLKECQRLFEGSSRNFHGLMGNCLGENTNEGKFSRLLTIQEFLFETSIDNFPFHKIMKYIDKSRIAFKIQRYRKSYEGDLKISHSNSNGNLKSSTKFFLAQLQNKNKPLCKSNENVEAKDILNDKEDSEEDNYDSLGLLSLLEFLKLLTCGYNDGRVLIENLGKGNSDSFIKYFLLNPAAQFHDIVKECRSVVVAGGTMSPRSEFRNQLFVNAGAALSRVREFSCGHVVSKENVLPLVVKKGPTGTIMDFTFRNRKQTHMMDELGRSLLNFCSLVPGGIVCFLPSYEYEKYVFEYFEKTGLVEKFAKKKTVFREPRLASQMDRVLRSYSDAATKWRISSSISEENMRNVTKTGAILFCVVGGKMSEGINFNDDLGRCVVMIGLPFPNSTSLELREKMKYLDTHFPSQSKEKSAGDLYYEALCFKAVNQSIGRSIRHRNDFASIVLLDHRYGLSSSRSNLPSWIESEVRVCEHFGQAVMELRKFFKSRS